MNLIMKEEKAIEFIQQLEQLIETTDENSFLTDSLNTKHNKKFYLTHTVKSAHDLIHYGEWLIALENTIDNIFETNLSLDTSIWELAKQGLPDDNPRLQDIKLVMLGDK